MLAISFRSSSMFAGALLALLWTPPAHGAVQQLPAGFISEPIETGWSLPVDLCFVDAARLLVAEKGGTVWYVENQVRKNLVLDLELETLSAADRGMLGIAIDPQFATNGLLYLWFVVDPNFDGVDGDKETYSRLVRYQLGYDAAGNLLADPSSRFDLLGNTWATGVPSCHLSHTVGTLAFLSDGSLVASVGDGAHFDTVDGGGLDAGCFGAGKFSSDQDIGSFRSVYQNTYAGKILRIDAATGLGLSDNPWFTGDPDDIASRQWAMGVRNPFRFTLVPQSGPRETLIIGDVGWNSWEELDVCRGGENFGWPCREGDADSVYASADPQGFCSAVVAAPTAPALAYHHSNAGSAGFVGNCVSGVAFYQGVLYPPIYRGALFFSDFGQSWMKVARLDGNLAVTHVLSFGTSLGGPIEIASHPENGDLVYISLGSSSIRRLRYVGTSVPPVAIVSASPAWGPAPLTVNLSGDQSFDLDGDPLEYSWDLGDGTTSTLESLVKVYPDAQNYTPTLTVRDPLGNTNTSEFLVTPGNTPPQIKSLTSPPDGFVFKPGTPFNLQSNVEDVENGSSGVPLEILWSADLVHGHHTHPDQATTLGASGSMTLPSHGPGTHVLLTLHATDERGLETTRTLTLYDAESGPAVHLVSISDSTLRLGQSVKCTVHVEYAKANSGGPRPNLVWDWGDGTIDEYHGLGHQQDVTATHLYPALGNYTLKLKSRVGSMVDVVQQPIVVETSHTAVAVFMPLSSEGWISWSEQQWIAQSLLGTLTGAGMEAVSFTFDQQTELVEWMTPYLEDGVRDVLVVLDALPEAVYAGQADGSLVEEWLEHGNVVVWSGYQPFFAYVDAHGTLSGFGAGNDGATEVLDSLSGGLCAGDGWQAKTPAGNQQLPSLPQGYYAPRALRYNKLGPSWHVAQLFAADSDFDSDAILLQHTSGGQFAEFMCTDQQGTARAAVLEEFLARYVPHKLASPSRAPGSVPPH